MFHLIDPAFHEQPDTLAEELASVAFALQSGFDLQSEDATEQSRRGFGIIAAAMGRGLLDLQGMLWSERAGTVREAAPARPAFAFPEPATPDTDGPEIVPAEGFAPAAGIEGIRRRLDAFQHNLSQLAEELDEIVAAQAAPALTEPVPGARAKRPPSAA